MNVGKFFSNHFAILGNSGSGKSYGTSKVIQSVFTNPNFRPYKASFLLFDNNGEYINAETPVVVLTANAISGAKEEYLAEGFCDYLKKPVDADKLENLLAGLIPEEKKHVVSVADTAKDIVSVGDELPYIEAIDWAHALMKLGDEKLLRVLVSDFSAMSLNDIKVLNEMFLELQSGKKEAFDAFRIKVHSMKSVAATIGADHIAGIAKYLEYAAKDYEHDTIDRLMPLFYREWSKLKVEIDEAFEFNKTEEKENLKSIDSSELNMFLDALNEAMDESDVDRADAVIEELELYSFPTEQTEILEAIKLHVLNIDADQCQKSISKWKEIIQDQ